jgi:hypothetical protein
VKNDGSSMIGLQPPEPPVELIVVIDQSDIIASRRFKSSHPDLHRLAHPAPALIGAGIHDQPMQPRLPTRGIAQLRQTLPSSNQGILDGVLCLVGVTEDESRNAVQPINGCGCEDFERLVVPTTRSVDEIALQR